ncbi:hypothetical protein SCHPADRAFT_893968 [Schizopora paradoxa]|uniref:C2H2-type domain-containing protein n=1 Tax=Schizopora paradoxa TaxID=27342 RepID=A0A0H2R8X4_9AGAM|nr:hypothetical protein SCHPADRAFT_893968 [Schizopora paradoxa]
MPAKRSSTTRSRVQCNKCEKTFRGTYELNRHTILHSNDKSKFTHKCPIPDCPYAALQKSNLKTHINSVHSKVRTYKCTVDPAVCEAVLSEASSLIRHEKAVHRFYRKEGEFRPVKPVVRKTRTKRSTGDEIAEPLTQEQLTTMLSSGSLLPMSPSPSPSTSTSPSSDSSLGYFSPSPSPDLPTPDALQFEYPQYFTYPDASFAPMPVDNSISFDPTAYNTQSFNFLPNANPCSLSAPEFIQGCSSSSYSMIPRSTAETCLESELPSLSGSTSFGLLTLTPSDPNALEYASTDARGEWMSLSPSPSLAELPSHSAPEYSHSTHFTSGLPVTENGSSAFNFGFANISTEFDNFLEEFGMGQ